MAAGDARGREHGFRIALGHARDVHLHRAVEKFDILGQVADMAAEILAHPGEDIRAVEPDIAHGGLERADQHADQRGLARGGRPDDGQALTGGQGKVHALDHRGLLAGEGVGHALDRDMADRGGQLHPLRADARLGEEAIQAHPALPRLDELLPPADQLLHRGQGAAHDDGGRDRGAGGQLLLQGEVGADSEDRDLHREAEKFGQGQQHGGAVCGLGLGGGQIRLAFLPARHDGGLHAHGVDDLGVAHHRLGAALADHGGRPRRLEQGGGDEFGHQGEAEQDHRAGQCYEAHQGMEEENHAQEHRHPGDIVDREHARRAEVAAQNGEVAQRLHPVGAAAQLRLKCAGEALGCHAAFDPLPQALHDQASYGFEHRKQPDGGDGDEREIQQRVQAAAAQDAVEHLHHVDGDGELQRVDDAAEHADRDEFRTARGERLVQRGLGGRGAADGLGH